MKYGVFRRSDIMPIRTIKPNIRIPEFIADTSVAVFLHMAVIAVARVAYYLGAAVAADLDSLTMFAVWCADYFVMAGELGLSEDACR